MYVADAIRVSTVRRPGGLRVLEIDVGARPSAEQVDLVASMIQEELARRRCAIHASHTGADASFSSVDHFQLMARLLTTSEALVAQRLVGTVVQTRALDALTQTARDVFLSLYRPPTLFAIAETSQAADEFLRDLEAEEASRDAESFARDVAHL